MSDTNQPPTLEAACRALLDGATEFNAGDFDGIRAALAARDAEPPCPFCAAKLAADAEYCHICGADVEAIVAHEAGTDKDA